MEKKRIKCNIYIILLIKVQYLLKNFFLNYSMGSPKVIFIIIRNRLCQSSIQYKVSVEGGSILNMMDQNIYDKFMFFKFHLGTSLVVHWVRLPLLIQGSSVLSLVQEDSTCCRPLGPCATAREPTCYRYGNPCALELELCNKRIHCNEKLVYCNKNQV